MANPLHGYATASNKKLGISYAKSGMYDGERTFGEGAVWDQQEGTIVFSVAEGRYVCMCAYVCLCVCVLYVCRRKRP